GGAGNVTIPVVTIDYSAGTNLIAHATTSASSPIVLSIGDGSNPKLGEFSGGRGAADTILEGNVTRAGVSPLWLVREDGGGWAYAVERCAPTQTEPGSAGKPAGLLPQAVDRCRPAGTDNRLYLDRVAGGHRDHRDSGRPALAGFGQGQNPGRGHRLHQQYQAT